MNLQYLKKALSVFKRAFGRYKIKIFILMGLGLSSGFLDAFGVGIFIPIISYAIRGGGNTGDDFISEYVATFFNYLHIEPSLLFLLSLLPLLFIIKAAVLFVFGYISIKIGADYEKDMRDHLYSRALYSSWSHLLKHKVGHLENMLMVQTKFASRMLMFMSGMILSFSSFLVYIFFAARLSPTITISLLVLGVMIFLVSKPLVRLTKKYSVDQALLYQKIAHEVNENIIGLKTIKAMNLEPAISFVGSAFFERFKFTKIKSHIFRSINALALQPIAVTFIAIVFYYSYNKPGFSIGVFAVTLYLIQKVFNYIEKLQDSLHAASSLIQYVQMLLAFEDDILDNQEPVGGNRVFIFNREFEFRDVNFGYKERAVTALQGINFGVRKGEMVGVVGPSGSGKTTFVDLCLRLFRPASGGLVLDGTPAEDINVHDWRQNVGYVSQDIFLKNDTIANNIKFYNDAITNEKMIEAAKVAHIYDFIKTLPKGFDTMVGERGIMLSGGQRQRIVLARVLARNPQILILDEATSALDNESEAAIRKAIENLKGSITLIIVAHRVSTVMGADRLIVFDNGRIIEEGAPLELLKNSESYFYKVSNIKV